MLNRKEMTENSLYYGRVMLSKYIVLKKIRRGIQRIFPQKKKSWNKDNLM